MSKINLEIFIERANKIHNFKYNYSKVEYKTKEDKVCIVCPIHGEFWQRAGSHMRGIGCPECGRLKSNKHKIENTKNKFLELIERKRIIMVGNYVNTDIHTEFECQICGYIWHTTPHSIRKGSGCPKCSFKNRAIKQTKLHESFIAELQKINSNIQVTSKYLKNKCKVECTCLVCGNTFSTTPDHLLRGNGCPKCAVEKRRITIPDFIARANKVHNNKYNYCKVDNLSKAKIEIVCPKHGSFYQTPGSHLWGCGCPVCRTSWGEKTIFRFLQEKCIEFTPQYKIHIEGHSFRIDFAIKHADKLYFIEYNGLQHYKPIAFFGGHKTFIKQRNRDSLVKQYCKNNNIELFEVFYSKSLEDIQTKIETQLNLWNVL